MSFWKRLGLRAVAAAAVGALGFIPILVLAQAATYTASLSGSGHTPPVTSTATGTFTMTMSGNTISYTLSVPTITAVTAAHIHAGAAGENGGVVVPLFAADAPASSVDTSGTYNLAELVGPLAGDIPGFQAALAAGALYVNVHTSGNPGGEIRGQITAGAMVATPTLIAADTGNAGLAARTSASSSLIALLLLGTAALALGGRVLTAKQRLIR